jgi:hypothetical protein
MAFLDDLPPAPRHQCLNMACGCNDLVSAGPCSEWCAAHTIELVDVEQGKVRPTDCLCGHDVCIQNSIVRGTPERGMA